MLNTDNIIPGRIVQHKLQKEWIMVLSCHESTSLGSIIKCRTKKLEVVEFYSFELELVPAHNCRKDSRNNEKRRK